MPDPSYPLSITQVPGLKPRPIAVSSSEGMCSYSEALAVSTRHAIGRFVLVQTAACTLYP